MEARIGAAGKRSGALKTAPEPPSLFPPTPAVALEAAEDEDEEDEDGGTPGALKSGAISGSVLQIFRDSPRRLNAQQVADVLERNHVPIRAKNYVTAARISIRRLAKTGRLKRVGTGFYRPKGNARSPG